MALRDYGIGGMRLGLVSMRRLLVTLDNPERSIPRIVHIAGTNGKGSVAAMMAAILQAAGYRTILYTSPSPGGAREAFQSPEGTMQEEEFYRLESRVLDAAAAVGRRFGEEPTAFECLTAMAYLWCMERQGDVLIQECGLGGRLDATNAVDRTHLSVITSVDVDHSQWLGPDVISIAREKAGILRSGTPVVTSAAGDALQAIKQVATERGCNLVSVLPWPDEEVSLPPDTYGVTGIMSSWQEGTSFRLLHPGGDAVQLQCPLLGVHQAINAATAAVASRWLPPIGRRYQAVDWATIRQGLMNARWPARLEMLSRQPLLVLDGAHNPAGMLALRESLHQIFPGSSIVLVCGMMADKDIPSSVRVWSGYARVVVTVPVPHPRSASVDELSTAFRYAGVQRVITAQSVADGIRVAKTLASQLPSPVICICGSLFLAPATYAAVTNDG